MPGATQRQALIRVAPMGAPRMTQRDRWKQRPVVIRYRKLSDAIRAGTQKLILGHHVKLEFVFAMPKSWSKKDRAEHDGQPHQQKPDIDNAVKAVLDALYVDDSTVHTITAKKTWGEVGSIKLRTLEHPASPLLRKETPS